MTMPIPHDIPLPLPAPEGLLKCLLVISFIAHLLFVNLMVGGAIFTLGYEIRGRKNALYDELALFIAKTITVNKSLAVVLGVAPLLLINVLYTVWFYSANALTGTAWIMVVPSVTVAFLLTYLHKYSWEALHDRKGLHIAIIAAAVALFLVIPLIFLTNITLMLFPDRWTEVRGFFSALTLPSVFPRYFHFLAASLAATGLFLVWAIKDDRWIGMDSPINGARSRLQKEFYSIAFGVSALQFLLGPLVLFSLPSQGLSWLLILTILAGAMLAAPALWLMWKEINATDETVGQNLLRIAGLLGVTVLFMMSGRHLYREQALASHRALVAQRTAEYQALVKTAREEAEHPAPVAVSSTNPLEQGKILFQACSACHAMNSKLIGPPLTEIARIYEGNPKGIVEWAKAPWKKRAGYPQMPPMALPDEDLKLIAEYMLSAGSGR